MRCASGDGVSKARGQCQERSGQAIRAEHCKLPVITQNFQMKKHSLDCEREFKVGVKVHRVERPCKATAGGRQTAHWPV